MFEKHCQICGIDVKKETAVKRFRKYFCSDNRAQKYTQAEMERHEREARKPRDALADAEKANVRPRKNKIGSITWFLT